MLFRSVFDNGGAFYGKVPESKIIERLQSNKMVEQSALGTITTFGEDGKPISLEDMFGRDYDGLLMAVKRNYPIIKDKMPEIEQMIRSIPKEHSYIETDGNTVEKKTLPVCSDERKDYYIKTMQIRLDKVLAPAYERAIGKFPSNANEHQPDMVHNAIRL